GRRQEGRGRRLGRPLAAQEARRAVARRYGLCSPGATAPTGGQPVAQSDWRTALGGGVLAAALAVLVMASPVPPRRGEQVLGVSAERSGLANVVRLVVPVAPRSSSLIATTTGGF